MLSFELSAIDLVLVIAVGVLLLLFLAQRRGHPKTKSDLSMEERSKLSEKPKASADFQKCVHHFGYLRNLPQHAPVPDECFGCAKVMRCLFPNEQDQLVH